MNACLRALLLILAFVHVPVASAQTFRYDLLSLLPDDFAVSVVVHDLHGHSDRWEKSDWLKRFHQSPLGKTIADSPEMKQLVRWQDDVKTHLQIDWPTFRDEILGDTLILSYSPGKNKNDEHGLFLLHARKPERLAALVERFNDVQKKSGELKSLTVREHNGKKYHRRVQGTKAQYYHLDGPLLAFSDNEDSLKGLLARRDSKSKDTAWAKRFEKAGAGDAVVTLCVNPRKLDPDFGDQVKKGDPLPSYWQGLDAVFVTLTIRQDAELRVAVQADVEQMPKWARAAFTKTAPASDLWQLFPERSLLTIAAKTDFAGTAEGLKQLVPEKDRKNVGDQWQQYVAPVLSLDPFKELLPNIGPDWGVCILPANDGREMPQAMIAIAVQPGSKEKPVDQALFGAVHFYAGLAVVGHNDKNPKNVIRIETAKQGNIEIKYLVNDKLFPAGYRPACALKEGYLVFATSPAAIERFQRRTPAATARKETPLLRVSPPELAKLLDQRRDHIMHTLMAGEKMPQAQAKQHVDNVISFLDLFDQLTISQHGDGGQASWSVRLTPAAPASSGKRDR